MTLIEKQTRDKLKHYQNKCTRMLQQPTFNSQAFDAYLKKANYYKSLLVQVDENEENSHVNLS